MMLKVFANWYYHFRCVWPGMSKLLKITSLIFLYKIAEKHESLLQIDTKIFWWVWSSILEVPKKASLQCLNNIPKKFRDEVDFFDADKHQSFLTVDFNILGIKVCYNVTGMIMKMYCHGNDQAFSKYSCNVFTISLKRSYKWSCWFLIKLSIFDESSQTCPQYQKKEIC